MDRQDKILYDKAQQVAALYISNRFEKYWQGRTIP